MRPTWFALLEPHYEQDLSANPYRTAPILLVWELDLIPWRAFNSDSFQAKKISMTAPALEHRFTGRAKSQTVPAISDH